MKAEETKMVLIYCPLCCDQPFADQQSLFFHLRGLRNNLFCSICSERFATLEALIAHLSRKCHGSPNTKCKVQNISNKEVEDVPDTDTYTTGEEDCIGGTDEEEEESVAIKQELEDMEVEDVPDTDIYTTGEEDCTGGTEEEEKESVAIKQELEDMDDKGTDDPLAFVKTEMEEPIEEDSFKAANSNESTFVFPCTSCNKTYTSSHFLKRHYKMCRGSRKPTLIVKPEEVSTDLLSFTIKTKGVKMHCCQFCEYKSNSSCSVRRHLVTHTGVKAFKCEVCEKTFTKSSSLKTHKRIHTGEKPYKCSHCDKAFSRTCDLKRHATLHSGERRFACTLCTYQAVESSALTLHMRVHTGEKPYSCTQCEYRTTQRCNLKTHMQNKHTDESERPYSCVQCEYRTTNRSNLIRHKMQKHFDNPT